MDFILTVELEPLRGELGPSGLLVDHDHLEDLTEFRNKLADATADLLRLNPRVVSVSIDIID
jgi:hypothetical protein